MPSQREARSTSEATALLDAADGAAHDAGKRDLYAEDRPGAHNSMSFWVAACFCINYVMGSGFLGLPAVFHDAGLLLSPVTLLFFMWLSDGTKDLLVEAMARREALARLDERHAAKLQASAEVRRLTRAGQHVPPDVAALASNPVRWRRRDFVVSHVRTFQVNELMLGLWGRTAEILYMVGVALYRERPDGPWLPAARVAWHGLCRPALRCKSVAARLHARAASASRCAGASALGGCPGNSARAARPRPLVGWLPLQPHATPHHALPCPALLRPPPPTPAGFAQ